MGEERKTDHGNGVDPGINCVAGTAQVRLVELVMFGPAKWSVDKTLLDDGMEPGKQEVQTSSLHRSLHTTHPTVQRTNSHT